MTRARVDVDPFVVLAAARYALGRQTAAVDHASAALIEHAAVVRQYGWAEQLIADIAELCGDEPFKTGASAEASRWRAVAAALLGDVPPYPIDARASVRDEISYRGRRMRVDPADPWFDRFDRLLLRPHRPELELLTGHPRPRPTPPSVPDGTCAIATILVPSVLRREAHPPLHDLQEERR